MVIMDGEVRQKNHISSAKLAAVITIIIAIVFVGLIGYHQSQVSRRIIPVSISHELSFSIYWPTKTSIAVGDKASIKYNPSEKLFSYTASLKDGNILTISEQPTPDTFVDVPNAYDKLIESMQKYKSFESSAGTIYLTRPVNLGGNQAGVMNSHGVLMFVKVAKDVTEDNWARFFNNLELQK